jgi:hypothetical protein
MSSSGWYFKEAIEHQLERLGAETWRFHGERDQFKVPEEAKENEVELSSAVYGAVLRPPEEALRTLQQLHDNVGDAGIAEALFGRSEATGNQ